MKNFFLSSTAAIVALTGSTAFAATATATTPATVSQIEVTTELDAIQNSEAAAVWANIDIDLAAAVISQLGDRIDPEGADIVIDIDEVSLATSFEQAIGTEEAHLKGDVLLRVPGPDNNENYTLTVTSVQAEAFFPDGTVIGDLTQGSDVYYRAMLDAFAENVVRNLDD